MPRLRAFDPYEQVDTVDQITEEDMQIFQLGKTNANYLTDYYLRGPQSGTYWRRFPDPPDPQREATWKALYKVWALDGKPEPVFVHAGVTYTIQWDDDGAPVFWHKHGWLWMPWQLQAYHDPRPEQTIVGGMGSGKTAYNAVSLVCMAMTIPHFRGFNFAPQMVQAQEVYGYIKNHFMDTPFWNRFVTAYPMRPYPRITIKNSFVGESTIEIYSIEKDSEKIRTLEGDVAFVDQGEKFENLDDVVRDIGSRLRGRIGNRPRIGRLCIVANAGDNPQLWTRYDQGEYQSKYFMSLNPSSYDNIWLTDADRDNLRRRVSSDANEAEVEQWMNGRRPLGKGEHFPGHLVKAATDDNLDKIMNERIEATDPGYIKAESPKLHVYKWEMPPEPPEMKRVYCVIGDPGQGNPPDRNSGVIMTWDITDFPKNPATMRGFAWIAGHGSYLPFFQQFVQYTENYQAKDRCAFDSTGTQKGFNELAFSNFGILAEPMDMAVSGKMYALNSLKVFLARGLIKFPYIAHLGNQLTNYRIPDNKIWQDLVMCSRHERQLYPQVFLCGCGLSRER